MMTLKEFQKWFEVRFLALIEEKSNEFLSSSNSLSIKDILSYINIYVQGGKRFRPYMVYVGYALEGGEHDIFPLLASTELLHLFCLVHDDVMDNETMRHGVATIHKHYEEVFQNSDIGRAIAILVGDLCLAWSIDCLEETEAIEPYTSDDVGREYRDLLSEVIHGQMLDIVPTHENTQQVIEKKMELKSARYSFFHPLYMGMMLAGADPEMRFFAEEYAVNLGMAFQLQDDMTDCVEDIKMGQQTLLSWYMFNEATEEECNDFIKYFGIVWPDEEEKKLLKVLEHSGALSFAREKIEEYYLQAQDAIFNHDKTGEEIWQEIIDEVKKMS
jgi:geranylgeranyl diphosphate synthase type I